MAEGQKDATAPEKEKAEPRKPSSFHIFVRNKGEAQWTVLDQREEAITQDDAKRQAARALAEDGSPYQGAILGDGLELAAVTARGFKPIVVKVEPQPAKLVLR